MSESPEPRQAAEHWDRVQGILATALESDPSGRAALLERACAGDDALRREVDSLIEAFERSGPIDRLASEMLSPLAARLRPVGDAPWGKHVAHYRLLGRLGGGGMGVVYSAHDIRLDREVALKFLPSLAFEDRAARERFNREAKLAASLDHPNICTIHETGETEDGQLFIAMPLYEGETLKSRLARAPVAAAEALNVALQVARGLARAHERGLVHRDITPSNIMITHDDLVKILDFGIAAHIGSALTAGCSPIGTVPYMSPEQLRGERVDQRADVWALGVVLFEMLAGTRPYRGEQVEAVLSAVLLQEPPTLRDLNPDVPGEVARVVERALRKDPADRYESAGEMARALEAIAPRVVHPTDGDIAPRKSGFRGRRRVAPWAGVAVSVVVAMAVLAGARQLREARGSPQATSSALNAIAVLPFTVRGSDALAYLGEAMVTLLSTKLDGAGELRSIDSRTLLGAIARERNGPMEPSRARDLSQRLGARTYVMGDIVEAGPLLRIDAMLYHDGRPLAAAGAFEVEGPRDAIFDLVDQLAARLLGSLSGDPSPAVDRIAAVTTSSLAALEAYVEGESAMRAVNHESAVAAFRRAVALDNSFALAYYRLSVAEEWLTRYEPALMAAEQAHRLGARLAERERRLLEVFVVGRRGEHAAAERLYRAHVERYPDEVEAWINLGELLFHTNALHGRSLAEAREPFERALEHDPDQVSVLAHLARIAASERRLDELDALVGRIQALGPLNYFPVEAAALLTFTRNGDPGATSALLSKLDTMNTLRRLYILDVLAVYARHLDGAAYLGRGVTQDTTWGSLRPLARAWLAHLNLAAGRTRAASAELAQLDKLDPSRALELRALFALMPHVSTSADELIGLRREVERLESTAAPPPPEERMHDRAPRELRPLVRPYLLGMLSARLGDTTRATGYARALEQLVSPPGAGTLAADFANSIRAQVALARGDEAAALASLERVRAETWYQNAMSSPFGALAFERFTRAELLREVGREREALAWYATLVEITPYETAYLGLAHMRRAQLHSRLGEPDDAVHHYERFSEIWRNADPELRPLLADARSALSLSHR